MRRHWFFASTAVLGTLATLPVVPLRDGRRVALQAAGPVFLSGHSRGRNPPTLPHKLPPVSLSSRFTNPYLNDFHRLCDKKFNWLNMICVSSIVIATAVSVISSGLYFFSFLSRQCSQSIFFLTLEQLKGIYLSALAVPPPAAPSACSTLRLPRLHARRGVGVPGRAGSGGRRYPSYHCILWKRIVSVLRTHFKMFVTAKQKIFNCVQIIFLHFHSIVGFK